MTTADELRQRAVRALNARRFDTARRLLARAEQRASAPADRARVLASSAFLAHETGSPADASAMCRRALETDGLDAGSRAVIRCQLALLQLRQGDTTAALDSFAAAIPDLADPVERGRALINRGTAYLARQEPRRAEHDLRQAIDELDAAGQAVEAAISRHNRGYALFLLGDLVGALDEMGRAREVLYGSSPVGDAISNQDRAEVFMAAGLVSRSVDDLREAARVYGARRMAQRQAEAELTLARLLLPNDARWARTFARTAARRFGRRGSDAWRVRAEAVVLEADAALGRSGPSLVLRGETLARELDDQGLPWQACSVRETTARIAVRRGDLARARDLVGKQLGAQAPLNLRLKDRDLRAELAAGEGRRANALQHLRAGLTDLHAWQSSFGSLDLQTGVAGHGVRLAARGLTLAVESGKPEVLFEWSERARMLASRVQPVRAPEDEQIVADLTELREMAAEGGQRDPDREAELRQRVRERAWQHRGSGEVADPVTLAELQPALDHSALVAYVVAADRVVALVVTADEVTWVDLGERASIDALLGGLLPDLDMAASDLPDAMAGFVRQELADRLASIAAVLVEPVLDAVGDRAVVLTPSGVLAGVPWTLLPGFTGRPVTQAQSATSWLARRTTPLRSATAGFVAGPRVARAEDEVTAAAKEWAGARVLTGDGATAAAVSDLASDVDVLHVAAHGRHSSENAMFSGLQLADGPWFGYDIDQLRQVPDVVLLSACEVGRSTVRWGDELIGMTTAWLHAGARCVIASAAAVNDRAAYDVLVAVHQQLAAGVDPAAALAAAVPAVSAEMPPVPLVCFG